MLAFGLPSVCLVEVSLRNSCFSGAARHLARRVGLSKIPGVLPYPLLKTGEPSSGSSSSVNMPTSDETRLWLVSLPDRALFDVSAPGYAVEYPIANSIETYVENRSGIQLPSWKNGLPVNLLACTSLDEIGKCNRSALH